MRNAALPSSSSPLSQAPRRGTLLVLLLAGTMALGLGACGRRGRPEPPPQDTGKPAAAQPARKRVSVEPGPGGAVNDAAGAPGPVLATGPNTTTADDEEDESNIEEPAAVSPQPIPQGRKKNPTYVVPKEPFILDFLL